MNFGFVINNRTCIGCHACSTACKSENEVPLGVYRTWVKYTETGTYPDSRRHFQVTRCNHCANPPCVRICPVTAMYQRDDGIVEFDKDQCIGCKACMQACPYDAIHIDPDTGTAAKCHYCSHRIDLGLEPACVVVCPEHAIIAGDLDDPESEISRVLAREEVAVRKPEQGTAPKLFYIEGNDVNLHPTAAPLPEQFLWAEVVSEVGEREAEVEAEVGPPSAQEARRRAPAGSPIRTPATQGLPQRPIALRGGRQAEHMVQVAYNAQHKIPWHWPVPTYLVTKGIAAGAFLLAAAGALFGWFELGAGEAAALGGLTVAFLLVTTALLVIDLERPERFLRILLRPQWKSWLVKGAFLLVGFSVIAGLWLVAEGGAALDLLAPEAAQSARPWLLGIGAPLAIGAAVYTAFLFGQAEGRDLWQSPLLPLHLLVQAAFAGAAAVLVTGAVLPLGEGLVVAARWTLGVALVADLFVLLLGEVAMPHASEVAARAAHRITHGPYRWHFWGGSLVAGHLLPLVLLALPAPAAGALAGLFVLVGLYLYEHAFVMAPQEIPNS